MAKTTNNIIQQLIKDHDLPDNFIQTVDQIYLPIAQEIHHLKQQSQLTRPLFIGINGSQGSGKSTLSTFLEKLLFSEFNLRCANLSIDDFYHTLATRQALANNIHPLLLTRGVPGTHDLILLRRCLKQLNQAQSKHPIMLPSFNKATNERNPISQWQRIHAPIDIILLEGWCVGLTAEKEEALRNPVNDLEKHQDPKGIWRTFINKKLHREYSQLFEQIDWLIFLQSPNLASVYQWRLLQETKLASKHKNTVVMKEAEIQQFVQHFERLTLHAFKSLPKKADKTLKIDEDHQFIKP